MNSEDGKSYYGIGLDNGQLRKDAEEAKQILTDIDRTVSDATESSVESVISKESAGVARLSDQMQMLGRKALEQSDRVKELLTNIPTVNIDFVSNAGDTAQAIEQAFAEIDRAYEANKRGVVELEAEYRRLAEEQRKANNRGDGKTAAALREQKSVVEQVIGTRKRLLVEIEATADQLHKEEERLRKQGEQARASAEKHVSLRQRLREIKTALVELEAAGQRGTAQYQALQAEAARLTDAWADASAQATILAHDQRGMQGVISGLSGLSGAASVAQGAMGSHPSRGA